MPCVDNKNLIYNIKELPETFSIAAGDMLVVETDDGTNIMDFNNFVIGLDNTTFGTTITQHSADLATVFSEVDSLSSAIDSSVAELSAVVDNAGFGSDTALLAETGYQILPTGLIMQWGVTERTAAFQETQEVTFPLAFPTGCLNIVGQIDRAEHNSGNLSLYLVSSTTTGATFEYDSDGETYPDTAIRWQAYGH
jgi:hypothetical protein